MSKDEIALEALGLLTKYEELKKEYDSLFHSYTYNYMHRWFDVQKMLPEKAGYYLVWCPNYTNYEQAMIALWTVNKEGQMAFWDFDPMNENEITKEVTHWTYLPNKPL